MPPNLPRIAAALNAYPWTPGMLTSRRRSAAPTYCAIGALLRYAGVAQEHIACAQGPGAVSLWDVYGSLLQSEYGIPDETAARAVMIANDSASSQAEAIERVLGVLAGTLSLITLMREMTGGQQPAAPPTDPTAQTRPDDETGSLALVG